MGKPDTNENEKDFEEIEVTELIERIEKLEKENDALTKVIESYVTRFIDIESALETVIESIATDESAGS